jgi:xanthine dehydrogenase accessory factor
LIHSWPAEGLAELGITLNTAIAVLSHDPKLDDAALMVALASPAFYVGALGSRSTNARRQARLRDQGLTNDQLTRLHAPIGVEISAATPEQIALSIMTQIIQVRNSQASSLESLSPAGVGGSL